MPRKRASRTSDDLAREIARLEGQRAAIEAAEHARRGELVRQYLGGPHGDALRQVLAALVAPADRHLFGLTPAAPRPRAAAPAPADGTGAADAGT